MSRLRQNQVTIAIGADLRDVLFTSEADPYTADRRELVRIWLIQETAGELRASILAGPVLFADQVTPAPLNRFPITTQDPPITVGLNRGERLKIPVTNLSGTTAFDLFYTILSEPV